MVLFLLFCIGFLLIDKFGLFHALVVVPVVCIVCIPLLWLCADSSFGFLQAFVVVAGLHCLAFVCSLRFCFFLVSFCIH